MRLIANVQMRNKRAVKTLKFEENIYLGDPLNIIRILNQKGAQEVILTDLEASITRDLDYELIKYIADEVTVPFSYAGGISEKTNIKLLASLGVERFVVNSSFFQAPEVVSELVACLGSSSVSLSIDIAAPESSISDYVFTFNGGKKKTELSFQEICERVAYLDIGELILRIVELDGCDGSKTFDAYNGFFKANEKLISNLSKRQLLIGSGIRNLEVMDRLTQNLPVDGFVVGSMVSFAKTGYGVLVNFPRDHNVL